MLTVGAMLALLLLAALLGAAALAVRLGHERLALAGLALAPLVAVLPLAVQGPAGPGRAEVPVVAGNPAAPARVPAAPEAASVATERAKAGAFAAAHDYVRARDAYAALVRDDPDDPDLWADLADAAAGAANGDLEAGADAIDRALKLAPHHVKALWLKASLELARHHYQIAAGLWRELLAALPAGSEDRRVVEANLREAEALAGTR